ncbi:MAG: M23 family metallopeptidase [Bdellovibrionota bacterium]
MTDEQQGYGKFGSGVAPVLQPRRSRVGSVLKIIAVFVIAAAIPFSLTGWGDFYQNIVEREPPTIDLKKPPVGLGLEPTEISFSVQDRHSGLDEIVVKLVQPGHDETVLKESYPVRIRNKDIKLTIDGKKLGIKEGDAKLMISVFDRSFWSNGAHANVSLRVDYTKPEISAFPDQHNAVRGGTEMVLYRLREPVDTFSGVTVGSSLYPGFPVKNFDSDFENFKDIYCVFFPVPRGFDTSKEQIQLFARDAVGNISTAPVSYRIAEIGTKQSAVAVSPDLLSARIDGLYEEYVGRKAALEGEMPGKVLPSGTDEERIERFHQVNREYRELIERGLRPIFGKPKSERFWEGAFARFSGREIRSFGERVTYKLGDLPIGENVENGVSFLVGADTDVRAANRGIVIFADQLGPYGKTIVIDHGFGLTSLYEHLESMSRLEGDRVERGDVVGRAGDSGLAFVPTLTFETRMHGVPVRPIEWWDNSWMNDHILSKLKNLKRTLGIRVVSSLE